MKTSHCQRRTRTANQVFTGGGVMGAMMRSLDWAASPFGPVRRWPTSLRTVVSLALNSPCPTVIFWGPDLRLLYNDACLPMLADKHPAALGQAARDCWPEIWHIIGPMLEGVFATGEATWSDDLFLPLVHHGSAGTHYFTFSYSPIRDEAGTVCGVFCPVTETTARVQRERHAATVAFLADLQDDFARLTTPEDIMQVTSAKIGAFLHISNCLFVNIDESHDQAHVVYSWNRTVGMPNVVGPYRLSDYIPEEFRQAARAGETIVIDNTQRDPRVDAAHYAAVGFHAYVTVPFHDQGTWRYLFTVNDAVPRRWQAEEITLIEEFTNHVFPRLERARAEAALRASEAKFATMFHASPYAIAITTRAEGRYLDVNEQFLQTFGVRREEVIGRTSRELGIWLDPADREQALALLAQQGIIQGREFTYRTASGALCTRLNSIVPLEEQGQACLLVVGTDITDRKQAEEALRAREARFRALVNLVPEMVWEAAPDGTMTTVSERWLAYTGMTAEQMAHDWPRLVLHPDDYDRCVSAWTQALRTGTPYEIEVRNRRHDGQYRWFLTRAVPVKDAEERILAWYGTTIDIQDRKVLEQQLQENEARLRLALDAAHMVAWAWDVETEAIIQSPNAIRVMGLTSGKLITSRHEFFTLVHSEDRPRLLETLQTSLREQIPYVLEFRLCCPDGITRWMEDHGRPRLSAAGAPTVMSGVIVDITARKQAEAALRLSEERFRVALQDSPITVFHHDRELRYTWLYNPTPGMTDDRILGKTDADVLAPEYADPLMALKRQVINEGRSIRTVVKTADNSPIRYHDLTMEPLRDAHGHIIGLTCAAVDITAQKQAEERQTFLLQFSDALAGSLDVPTLLQRLTSLLVTDLADYSVVTVMEDGHVQWLEAAAADPARLSTVRAAQQYTTNIASETPIPRVVRTHQPLLVPDLTDTMLQAMAQTPEHLQLLRSLEPRSLLVVPLLVHDRVLGGLGLFARTPQRYGAEELRLAQEVAQRAALALENARLYHVSQQMQTALTEHTQELQRINDELQQFAHIVSHDLTEPLRTMHNYVQLLARTTKGKLDSDAEEYMAFVIDAALRMQQMLTDLLAYTRAGQTPEFKPVDCEAVLSQVLSALQARITECGAIITHDPLPTIQGDATRIGQVLQNLIGNALKFCEEKPPRIHLAAVKEDSHWRFTVRDNGIGIDPQQIGRLFQVFQRLHTSSEYAGSGIGLAICKKIIAQHGGRIWVESKLREGSTFHFTISDHEGKRTTF